MAVFLRYIYCRFLCVICGIRCLVMPICNLLWLYTLDSIILSSRVEVIAIFLLLIDKNDCCKVGVGAGNHLKWNCNKAVSIMYWMAVAYMCS